METVILVICSLLLVAEVIKIVVLLTDKEEVEEEIEML